MTEYVRRMPFSDPIVHTLRSPRLFPRVALAFASELYARSASVQFDRNRHFVMQIGKFVNNSTHE